MSFWSKLGRGILGAATLGGSEVLRAGAKGAYSAATAGKRGRLAEADAFEASERTRLDAAKPGATPWATLLGDDGQLKAEYQTTSNLNTDFLDRQREDAMRDPGEASQWRELQGENLQRDVAGAGAAAQSQTANALSQLSMQGGVSAGAAERLTAAGGQNALLAQQDVRAGGLDLDIADEQMRQNQLSNLGQTELAVAGQDLQNQQFNTANALTEVGGKRSFDQNKYNQDMAAHAADRTASATQLASRRSNA